MPSYKTRFIRSEVIAEDTMAFHFEKPEGFTFKAGQFGDWKLIDPAETDDEGSVRAFSFANAPFEPTLLIATRLREILASAGVDDDNIRTEEFSGY